MTTDVLEATGQAEPEIVGRVYAREVTPDWPEVGIVRHVPSGEPHSVMCQFGRDWHAVSAEDAREIGRRFLIAADEASGKAQQ